eukprot:3431160-Pleurochrysis_carterae.AAC.1
MPLSRVTRDTRVTGRVTCHVFFECESEDARFAPELREAIGLEEVRVGLLPKMSALASTFIEKCENFFAY